MGQSHTLRRRAFRSAVILVQDASPFRPDGQVRRVQGDRRRWIVVVYLSLLCGSWLCRHMAHVRMGSRPSAGSGEVSVLPTGEITRWISLYSIRSFHTHRSIFPMNNQRLSL